MKGPGPKPAKGPYAKKTRDYLKEPVVFLRQGVAENRNQEKQSGEKRKKKKKKKQKQAEKKLRQGDLQNDFAGTGQ